MAHLLGGENLHLEFPTRVVFDSVSLGVDEGDRIGIVGRNGDGKSSLLAMLAGLLDPDSGRVTVRGGVRVGVLDQGDTLDDALTVAETVVGDRPEYEWAGDATVRGVIAGLVGDLDWNGPVAGLSGGQRRRVALARLLAGDWDVLALDEPRNSMGCTFRTPRFYRRGGQTSRPGARYRARARRVCAPGLAAPIGKVGR